MAIATVEVRDSLPVEALSVKITPQLLADKVGNLATIQMLDEDGLPTRQSVPVASYEMFDPESDKTAPTVPTPPIVGILRIFSETDFVVEQSHSASTPGRVVPRVVAFASNHAACILNKVQ